MNWKNLIIYFCVGVIISSLFCLTYLWGLNDDDMNKAFTLSALKNHVIDNDLLILDRRLCAGCEWLSDKDLWGWHEIVKLNYKYETDTYDCRYWSFVWALYFEKHGIDYSFVTNDIHILVMANFDDKFCFADLDELRCYPYE